MTLSKRLVIIITWIFVFFVNIVYWLAIVKIPWVDWPWEALLWYMIPLFLFVTFPNIIYLLDNNDLEIRKKNKKTSIFTIFSFLLIVFIIAIIYAILLGLALKGASGTPT